MNCRVFRLRTPQHEWVLETGGRHLHLSRYLAEHDLPRDLLALCAMGFFENEELERRLREDRWEERPLPVDEEIDLPLQRERVGKILALGKNFSAHAAEFGEEVPAEPLFFNKLPELLVPTASTVTVPSWYDGRVDHEAEVAVVIGAQGRDLTLEEAERMVAGYTVANDLTARSLQQADRQKGFPWLRGKNLDGFCPLGPCFVPRECLDVSDLRVRATVNGQLRQDATTADWVVDVPHALAYLSRHLTLRSGDIVLMGTPEGVGPLDDGDEVICEVEGIGALRTTIARP